MPEIPTYTTTETPLKRTDFEPGSIEHHIIGMVNKVSLLINGLAKKAAIQKALPRVFLVDEAEARDVLGIENDAVNGQYVVNWDAVVIARSIIPERMPLALVHELVHGATTSYHQEEDGSYTMVTGFHTIYGADEEDIKPLSARRPSNGKTAAVYSANLSTITTPDMQHANTEYLGGENQALKLTELYTEVIAIKLAEYLRKENNPNGNNYLKTDEGKELTQLFILLASGDFGKAWDYLQENRNIFLIEP